MDKERKAKSSGNGDFSHGGAYGSGRAVAVSVTELASQLVDDRLRSQAATSAAF
jgi:hypothetical protein